MLFIDNFEAVNARSHTQCRLGDVVATCVPLAGARAQSITADPLESLLITPHQCHNQLLSSFCIQLAQENEDGLRSYTLTVPHGLPSSFPIMK